MHPAAKMIRCFEVSIIRGNRGEAMALVQHLIQQIKTFAQIIFNGAAVIVNFNRMGRGEQGTTIFNRIA